MGNYLFGHPLTWLYRKLGHSYPAAFICAGAADPRS